MDELREKISGILTASSNEKLPAHVILNMKVDHILALLPQWNTRPTPDSIKEKLEFNPDWDMLKASQDALRECMKELNKLHDLTKDIEWVGECDICVPDPILGDCPKCQGKPITRPATLEECLEVLPRVLNLDDEQIPSAYANNGVLRVRSG